MNNEDDSPAKGLRLKDVVLLGRTFDEYRRMFNLDAIDPEVTILDVASGVSSFCAEASTAGYRVTASDRIYQYTAEEIAQKCAQDLATVMEQLPSIMESYHWVYFREIDELKRHRQRSYRLFVEDFRRHGQRRYIATEYPRTTFADGQFDIALVSHLLFLYDKQLTYDFHRQTIAELLRISSQEIRIFPLISLSGKRSPFVGCLLLDPVLAGCQASIQSVAYEFMRGGHEMMVIRKHPYSG